MEVTILTEPQLRQVVEMDHKALAAVADGFVRLARGQATMPPIMRVDIPENNGEVDIKSAYLQGLDSFAVKISSGFFNNAHLGLPSLGGMMILLSSKTGFPLAVLLDNGYLTDVRTALAGALAARHLAPEQVDTVGVIGSGAQARYQLQALQLVRPFRRVLVYSRNPANRERYAQEMRHLLECETQALSSAEAVVRESDLLVTTTPSHEPVVRAEWLHPGLHITAMGADAETKQELEAELLGRADLLVCDTKAQAFRLGELHHGLEAGVLNKDSLILELGDLIAGGGSARRDSRQITICDLTGTGAQDTAIARLAYEQAQSTGLGMVIDG